MWAGRNFEEAGESTALETKDEKLLFYSLLRNPVRREIINLLKINGEMAATDLKRVLGISVGTLYYHLEFLQPFVTKNSRRKYVLSDRGWRLVESMRLSDVLAEASVAEEAPLLSRILTSFTLNPLLGRVLESSSMLVPVAFLSSLIYILLSWRVSNAQILLHFKLFPTPELAAVSAGLNILILIAVYVTAGLAITRRRGGEGVLAASIPISLTPSNIFLATLVVLAGLGLLENTAAPTALTGLYIFMHVWQLGSLSSVLVTSKGLGWEKALLPSILISYLSLMLSMYVL
ncbi:MAG: helix-turn-helix domain-containing protein [Nitrososphaerota archaeon]